MSNNRIFLTGGTGPLGQLISKELIDRGYQIKALYRNKPGENAAIGWIKGDLLDPAGYEAALDGIDVIIHLEEIRSYNARDQDLMHKINVLGTRDLVDAALHYRVKKIIFFSCAESLIKSGQARTIELNSPGNPIFYSNYARTKFQAELEVWRAAEEGISVSILNSAIIYSTTDEQMNLNSLDLLGARFGLYPGGNIGLVSAINIIRSILNLMEKDSLSGQYLLCTQQCSFKELGSRFAETKKLPQPKYRINAILLALWAEFHKMQERLGISKSPWGSEWIRQSGIPFTYDTSISMISEKSSLNK